MICILVTSAFCVHSHASRASLSEPPASAVAWDVLSCCSVAWRRSGRGAWSWRPWGLLCAQLGRAPPYE
eukprot:1688466-Pyramimonas_sp.AAC.1